MRYINGIPHKRMKIKLQNGKTRIVEYPVIKSLAGLLRYMKRFGIDESEILKAFDGKALHQASIDFERQFYIKRR